MNRGHTATHKQHTLRPLFGLDCSMLICRLQTSRSEDFNKRRIGSLQSCNGFQSMVFADVGDDRRSSQYSKLDWTLIDDPTIISPSRFPQTPTRCQRWKSLK